MTGLAIYRLASSLILQHEQGQAPHLLSGRQCRDVDSQANLAAMLYLEAIAILEEDRLLCRSIGRHGAALLKDGDGVLTHCNAGGLATAEYGTALAVILGPKLAGVPVLPMPMLAVWAVGISAGITLLASYFPARRAARLDPCAMLQEV